MRLTVFASRNTKEILRDPLTFCFGLGFPVVLLLLLSAINSAIPERAQMTMFNIDKLTPGITVFGMSFISLFSSMLIAKDRTTSFMMRLFTSPLKAYEFIIGYTLPLLPMAILQSAVCVVVAFFLGLDVSVNILLMLAVNIPIAVVFISLGLLLGTLLNEKAVGGICGALLTNLSAWFSNIWFDTAMIGGWFKSFANALPFAHAVNAARDTISGNYSDIMPELLPVCGYAVVLLVLAAVVFSVMMKRNK